VAHCQPLDTKSGDPDYNHSPVLLRPFAVFGGGLIMIHPWAAEPGVFDIRFRQDSIYKPGRMRKGDQK